MGKDHENKQRTKIVNHDQNAMKTGKTEDVEGGLPSSGVTCRFNESSSAADRRRRRWSEMQEGAPNGAGALYTVCQMLKESHRSV